MDIEKIYNPADAENKWYKYWLKNQLFKSIPNEKEPFTIVIPPPNVTGVLHMGHMLNNTIQDVLIRRARMMGKNACWVPGTDHASIATEAKVVTMLREKGIKKSDISRDEFLKYAWEWKNKYGDIILQQLQKMGASADWDRVHFTMDENYYKAVIKVFVDLYNKGYIYRGLRMINWDCEAKTALSNEEVLYKEDGEKSILYHIKYKIKNGNNSIVIATQRPETIMGDTAVAVNPNDERYQHLIGKTAIVPIINREIPIITDDYVEKEFGSGCLKVTPAHDINDYEIGKRHHLSVIDCINLDGTLNELCEIPEYIGKDRFEVKKLIVKKLKDEDILVKEEEFITRIGRSERTNSVVEPKLSLQWFIKMKALSAPALHAVENNEIQIHPAKFKNTYKHWMENVRDWCISRQLWWGHQIPAYYYGNGENDFVVAETKEDAIELIKQKLNKTQLNDIEIKQDEDVLDTWASSWLWPIAVFDGFNEQNVDSKRGKINKKTNTELAYYYPTNVLVTAPEILFFWVARMVIAGYEYLGEKPFSDVYLTGIVRDKQGRKMSKSLGNSPDPLELISRYGADGMRVGMLLCSPAGNDLPFDESLCEQGRNFANKIWNAFRLIKGWEINTEIPQPQSSKIAQEWFDARCQHVLINLGDLYAKFRISEALMATYKFIWDDFCSWYLEMIKPAYLQPIDSLTYHQAIANLESILRILHPFMPFITEEIWHHLFERKDGESIMITQWPNTTAYNPNILKRFAEAEEIVTQIRNYRKKQNIPFKEKIKIIVTHKESLNHAFNSIIIKLVNADAIQLESEKPKNSFSFITHNTEYFIPYTASVDAHAEMEKLKQEIDYLKGFIESVNKKLSNEKFMSGAPSNVVEAEKKKKTDAEQKIKKYTEQLESFS
ncbi:MAG: valine--tRNA ligase [Flavobacteriales bacterium]|nr:valine--tRNA ligase [Flavobacteriales bacterium]